MSVNMQKKDNLQRHYSFWGFLELVISVVISKLFIDRRLRYFNFPIIIKGRKFIDFGKNLTAGYYCRFEVYPKDSDNRKRIIFGNNIQLNDFVHISAIDRVVIGDNCLMASHIYISDNSHGRYDGGVNDSSPLCPPDHREYITAPVKIGKNCWIGEGVIIMPGVTIGDGCVIGAHSIVKSSIPEASIAVGSPAKVVKRYSFELKKWIKVK